MKTKILIYSMSILSLFLFTGCDSRTDAKSLTALSNQTERIENVVTIDGTDNISSVSPSTFDLSGYNSIQNHKANSYNNMTRENQLKQEIISLNSEVKCCLKKDVKLAKGKANALKTLTSNISENISKYNKTKSEVTKNVRNINRSLKVPNVNTINAESEYISLNGNMSERYVYLCNIYDNLEQAYFLICENCPNCTSEETPVQEQTTTKQNKITRFKKNIDSYAPQTKTIEKNEENKTEETQNNSNKNIDSFINNVPPVNNGYNNTYGYPNMPINGGYNQYNGYYYNHGYGYANGLRRFNPGRNTDSFYPYNRNIDTYRFNPNFNYPVNGNPIEENNSDMVENNENFETQKNHVIEIQPKQELVEENVALEEVENQIINEVNDGNEIFEEIKTR